MGTYENGPWHLLACCVLKREEGPHDVRPFVHETDRCRPTNGSDRTHHVSEEAQPPQPLVAFVVGFGVGFEVGLVTGAGLRGTPTTEV
jgi:hypothetical protein